MCFVAPDLARFLVHGAIEAVAINRRGTGVHPQTWSVSTSCERLTQQPCGVDPRLFYFPTIRVVVAAINATSGQIDEHVSVL